MREVLDSGSVVLAVASRQKYTPLQVLPAMAVSRAGISRDSSSAISAGSSFSASKERLRWARKLSSSPADRFGKLNALRSEGIPSGQ